MKSSGATFPQESGGRNRLEESLQALFAEVFLQVSKRSTPPAISVTFYPFVGLNHTIRIRKQHVYVRISDLLCDAPNEVYCALAQILVRKLFRRRPKAEDETLYHQYIYQPHILRASQLAQQSRGRKRLHGARGRKYDLDQLFTRLNHQYFDNALSKPVLTWSARRTKRILGHHDSVHNTIVISRSLDKETVPEYVVEYVMYHEMLHVKHKPRLVNGRRVLHSPAFRAEEKLFTNYEEAIRWLAYSLQRVR